MQYNFDEVVDRSKNYAAKYDERQKKFGTNDVIPLWIADMDFRTAQPIIDALKKRAEDGIYGYVSRPDSYFKAGCDWQLRRKGWKIDPAFCSWSLGIVPAMTTMAILWARQDQKILIQTPVYGEFYEIVENTGHKVVENPLMEKDGKWSIDWADLEKKLQEVSMFLFCNPHNPLGIVWDKETISRIVELCAKYHVQMVSDEIHSDLIFHGKKFIPACTVSELAKKTVIACFSGTKTFNLAGLQACTIVFPDMEQKKAFDWWWSSKDIHRNNAFSIVAMETCFNEGEEWLEQLLPYISKNFDFINEYCSKYIPRIHPNVPDATYLVWLDCRKLGMTNKELHDFMIQKAKLGLNDGCDFGRSLTGYMRLNAACPRSVLEKALGQLKDAVDALKEQELISSWQQQKWARPVLLRI